MSNPYKIQLIADGVNRDFNFSFELVQQKGLNVYITLDGQAADEVNDLVADSNYSIVLSDPNNPSSVGLVRFNTAPAANSTITITPQNDASVTSTFNNVSELNAYNLDGNFDQHTQTLDYTLQNYEGSCLRYNYNAPEAGYDNRLPLLENDSWWMRKDQIIVSQDYDSFLYRIEIDLGNDFSSKVNAGADNTNLAAQIASNPYNVQYSGQIKTIDNDGNIVVGPTITGFSALAGAEASKDWAVSESEITDPWGNAGRSAKYWAEHAAASAAVGNSLITTLEHYDEVNPTSRVDLIDYSVTPNEPWKTVLPNTLAVFIDDLSVNDETSYDENGIIPNPVFTVTAEDIPTLANPSYITFPTPIASGRRITIKRGVPYGGSDMFSDSSNAIFNGSSKVAKRDLNNVDNIGIDANVADKTLSNVPSLAPSLKTLLDQHLLDVFKGLHPINSVSFVPYYNGQGMTWEQLPTGYMLHTTDGTTVGPFDGSKIDSTIPGTDGCALTNQEIPQYLNVKQADGDGPNDVPYGGLQAQANLPHAHSVSWAHAGVEVWRRVA